MPSPIRATQKDPSDPLSVALDELYAAPLDSFVARRRDLVSQLRTSGEAAASRIVAAVGKPTRTAWALNRVARQHPELLRAAFGARDAAVAAQASGDLESVRAATRSYRERVADVVRAARESLAAAGVDASTTQARAESRRISETLQAAHADASAMRERLLAGRLTRDIEVDDPFAGLEVSRHATHGREPSPLAPRAPVESPRAPERGAERETERQKQREIRRQHEKEKEEKEKREKQRAIEAARRQVASLDEAARLARATADESRLAAERAQAAAERAKTAATEADERLDRARSDLRALDR